LLERDAYQPRACGDGCRERRICAPAHCAPLFVEHGIFCAFELFARAFRLVGRLEHDRADTGAQCAPDVVRIDQVLRGPGDHRIFQPQRADACFKRPGHAALPAARAGARVSA
jgi:hypothetical protein